MHSEMHLIQWLMLQKFSMTSFVVLATFSILPFAPCVAMLAKIQSPKKLKAKYPLVVKSIFEMAVWR